MPVWGILLIILGAAVAVLIVMYILGRRMQKKQEAQKEQIEAAKQTTSMLIIDKKRLRITRSGLPQVVIDQTPKLMRRNKLPIVKAKIGPKIVTLVADEKIYDLIPVKKQVKAEVSGIYIVNVKGIHGSLLPPPKKKRFTQKLRDMAASQSKKADEAVKQEKKSKKNK